MSSLMQTIAEVDALRRAIDQQLSYIEGFKKSNADNISLVQAELKGSTNGYDQMMLRSLDRASTAIDKAVAELTQAKSALDTVVKVV